jgi:hypothetical protein
VSGFDRSTVEQGQFITEGARRATGSDGAILFLASIQEGQSQTLQIPVLRDGVDARHVNVLMIEALLHAADNLIGGHVRILLQKRNGRHMTLEEHTKDHLIRVEEHDLHDNNG